MPLRREFSRYLVAGTLAFLCDFLVFMALTGWLGVHYLAANAAGFCFGLAASYLLNVRWVFSERTYASIRVEFPVFLAISLVTLVLGELIILALVEGLALSEPLAKIVMTGFVFLANFVLRKLLLFRRRH